MLKWPMIVVTGLSLAFAVLNTIHAIRWISEGDSRAAFTMLMVVVINLLTAGYGTYVLRKY